jgi:xanthine dehydrogenase accessory factor
MLRTARRWRATEDPTVDRRTTCRTTWPPRSSFPTVRARSDPLVRPLRGDRYDAMRELMEEIDRWRDDGKRVAIAKVIDIEGSGPRGAGAAMAVTEDGLVAGSVSGGCVEGAVVEAALEALLSGRRSVHTLGYSDSDAFAVGLTCGGRIRLFVEPLELIANSFYEDLAAAVRSEAPVALATLIDGPTPGAKLLVPLTDPPTGTLGDAELDRVIARDARGDLAAGMTRVRSYGAHGEAMRDDVRVFIESFVPPPQMIIFGAIDFTAALVRVAKVLGYRVTVCDARPVFATRARFPLADEIIVDWPNRLLEKIGPALTSRDAICVLTHDIKFDVPAVVAALATEVGYLGAMGSRRTNVERAARLREAGVDDTGLARLHAPIGLDIGARTPEETAVSVCAEIISARNALAEVRPLRATDGPIHRRA